MANCPDQESFLQVYFVFNFSPYEKLHIKAQPSIIWRGKAPHLQRPGVPIAVVLLLVVAGVRQEIPLGVPRDGEGGGGDVDGGHLLARGNVADVDGGVLRGRGQQLPVVAEGDGAHRPLQAGEGAHARQLGRVPQRYEGVGAAHREVLARGIELDAYAVAGVRL